ncbi:hypothetical protein [Micromonospora tulbaghiae]|uniref:HNH endonuclease n=1 Tax=Micromonospora tulbaghiae TaxID=479978 RepID=UPI0036ADB08D
MRIPIGVSLGDPRPGNRPHGPDHELHPVRISRPDELRGTQAWAAVMARRKRKALVVCDTCHGHIHAGQPTTLTA